jgi:predicted dehydrogenase
VSLKLAVVGAGDIGRRHLQAIETEGHAVVAAVVDPVPRSAALAATFGVPHFADIARMADAVAPDGVIIAAPNDQHVPLARACIERGIPALVEKPISNELASAYALADLSETTGVPILVGHHRRHNPRIQLAKAIIQSGELGRVTAVSGTWLVRKPDEYFQIAWRTRSGGGPILINLIHDIDCLRFLVGEIDGVMGVTSSARRALEVEDTAAAILRFENGAVGTIVISDSTPAPWSWELTAGEQTSYTYPRLAADCYQIAGTSASLAVPSLRTWRYDGVQSWQAPLTETQAEAEPADSLVRQIGHFVSVIEGAAEPIITARDAARTLEATLAVITASRTRAEVSILGRASAT